MMRLNHLFWLLCFLGTAVSCDRSSDTEKLLERSERLVWEEPDSALSVLNRLRPERMRPSSAVKHGRYRLLALCRLGRTLPDDSLIVDLKRNLHLAEDSAAAKVELEYLHAMYWMDRRADSLALHRLKAAESLPMNDLRYRSLVHSNLGYLYLRQGWLEKSMQHYRTSIAVNRSQVWWDWLANDLYSIYPVLYLTRHPDKDTYLQELLEVATRCSEPYRQSVFHTLGWTYLQSGRLDLAEHYLLQALSFRWERHPYRLYQLLAQVRDRQGHLSAADSLYREALQSRDIFELANIHRSLYDRLSKQGKTDSALYHLNLATWYKDSIDRQRELEKFAAINFQYDRHSSEIRYSRNVRYLCFIIVLIIACTAILLKIYRKDVERTLRYWLTDLSIWRNRLSCYWQTNRQLRQLFREHRLQNAQQQAIQSGVIGHLKAQLKQLRLIHKVSFREEGLSDSDIRSFGLQLRMQHPGFVLRTDEDFRSLLHWYDLMHDRFAERLKIRFGDLNGRQQVLCCLLASGYDTGYIARLLDIREESVIRNRIRLYKVMDLHHQSELEAVLKAIYHRC